MEDLNEAGGVYAVMNELTKVGLLDTDLITATGKTVGENIKGCEIKDTDIIRPVTIHTARQAVLLFSRVTLLLTVLLLREVPLQRK